MHKKLSTILLILCFGNILGLAQQTSKEKPVDKTSPTGLVLEVNFYKGRPPGFISVGDSLQTMRWAWYGWFERVPNFQTSAEKPPVQAVKFIPSLEDGVIKVKVRVFVGQKNFEREEQIALYSMREGERVSVKELSDYGVVPFEIAVARVAPTVSAALPSVENKTTSLQVTAIEPNFSTLPTYKLSLLNNSQKAISAFTFETFEGDRKRISGMPHNQQGENLIEPGTTITKEMQIPLEYKKTDGEEVPKPAGGQKIVISSVVFADGSYEGDAARAAAFRALSLDKKIQVRQIIALLESNEAVAALNYEKIAAQAAKLETKVAEREFNELLKQFPSLNEQEKANLRIGIEAGAGGVKMDFISGTKRYQSDFESNPRAYLKGLKEAFQKWLARLQ